MRASARRAVLLIVIDALPWELVRQTDFLSDVGAFRGSLKTVLGYSGAALPTLFSGVMPAEHGHWAMYYYDPAGSPFGAYRYLLGLARRLGGRGLVRRLVEKTLPLTSSIKGYFKLYDIPLDLLPQYSLAETKDIFSPGGLRSAPSFFDILEEGRMPYRIWSWRTPEAVNFKDMFHALEERHAQVFFLYTPELDAVMHANGVFSMEARAKLREQEARVREAYRLAEENYESVSLLVFSDHGMTDVTQSHDLMGYVKSNIQAEVSRDYLPFYDSTMARYWGRRAGVLEQIAGALAQLDYGAVLSRDELENMGLNFTHTAYGEMVFLLKPGHVIVPSFMGVDKPAAMHGFHPGDRFSYGTYISNHALEPEPSHISDMLKLMVRSVDGLRPEGLPPLRHGRPSSA